MSPQFYLSENYKRALSEIEDFVYESSKNLAAVEKFLDTHDRALEFVGQHPNTPAVHPQTGDQSWLFGDGRYRIFFRVVAGEKDLIIYLTHIIDNRSANFDIYPTHSLSTYEVD